jgi:hypothetical protein
VRLEAPLTCPFPSPVIKQRMQVHESQFRSLLACARTVYRTEGLGAFYVSYPTTLTMTVPFTAVQFTVYEHLKRALNPTGEYSPAAHALAGGVAGGVAAGATTPLDVAKTLLQTRGTSRDAEIRAARGMADACRIIWQRDGLRGFARGLTPRVVTFMPSNALCWLSYEFFSECRELFGGGVRGRLTGIGRGCDTRFIVGGRGRCGCPPATTHTLWISDVITARYINAWFMFDTRTLDVKTDP